MARGKKDIEVAKKGFRGAKNRGDREEEARWANQVGHAYKERGQYVEALKWFRLDYEISTRRIGVDTAQPINLMPTCQSMGEIYLRLQDYDEALTYQRKHFQLAEESNNLVEQQRASTQLGRTYLEIYEQKDDFSALQNAKTFLQTSLELATILKESPPNRDSPSFVKEIVDGYNNMGLLRMITDDTRQALKLFQQGLKICDEEELSEDDDARSRLHHNLGRLYCEQREWDKAKQHTELDIGICNRIPHPQGEAKGYINLGEIHFKSQNYDEARRCFGRALKVAQSLEDEDNLVSTAQKNMEVVEQAEMHLVKFQAGLQQLKRLQREKENNARARGSHCSEEFKLLHELIAQAEELQAWDKHLKLAKSLKRVVKETGDMEKLGDALEIIGQSYYNLRIFEKAKKWHLKSWDVCKRIDHVEGQSVAKINYGNTLDCTGDWEDALKAYGEAFEIAMSQGKTKMIPQQISALENMHYCYFVRLEHLTDARIVESKIKRLKQLQELQKSCSLEEYDRCSETDNEAEDVDVASEEDMKAGNTDGKSSLMRHSDYPIKVNLEEECSEDDDLPLSTLRPQKPLSTNIPNGTGKRNRGNIKKQDTTGVAYVSQSKKQTSQNENLETQYSSQSKTLRKRPRIVLSDEEGNHDIVDINEEVTGSETQPQQTAGCSEDSESKRVISKKEEELIIFCKDVFQENILQTEPASSTIDLKMTEAPKEDTCELSMNQVEQQQERSPVGLTCGSHSKQFFQHNEKPDHSAQHEATASQNIGPPVYWNNSKVPETISVNMVGQIMKVDLRNLTQDNAQLNSIDSLKQEVVRIYSCNNPAGMKPLLRHLVLKGTILQAAELVEDVLSDLSPEDRLEAIVDGWIPMPLIERYQVFCQLHHEKCNINLVNQLKNCQATEDKVAASGCNLDDRSAWPLLMALTENGTFTHLDFSHNSLGIYSIQKIQQMIAIGNQVDLGLTLDFHHNNLGAASLGHICNCPIILSRLEVLNLSSNRLTDAAARHLATLVKNCRALEVLKLEGCDLTTRTILKIASALQADSPLIKLALGKNNPISSLAIAGLLDKLSSLESFSELDLTGVNLDKPGVERICLLLNASLSMSSLMLGETGIQSDGALVLSNAICSKPEMLVKLDISFCAISLDVSDKLCSEIRLLRCLTHLNLSGNKLSEKGVVELALVLLGSGCRLRALLLKRCRVGRSGMLILLKALQGNNILQLLDLEGNCTSGTVPFSFTTMNCTPDGMLASDRTVRTEQLEPVTPKHPKTSLKLKGELSRPTSGCSNELNRGDHATGAAYAASDTQKKRNDLCGSEDKPHDILPKEEPNPADNEVRAISSSEICTEVCPKYDVADSEDEGGNGITTTRRNHMDEDCASSSQKLEMVDNESGADRQETNTVWVTSTSLMGQAVHCNTGELVDELATALSMAQGLQYLSLSENELSSESVQRLYMAWSCSSRCASMPSKHVDGKVIHFTSDNKDCCSIKRCCEPG